MRISVNRKLNVAYVHLQDSPEKGDSESPVETKRLSEDLLMDVGPDGTVYGLELLNANEQLRSADLAELEIENADSGETTRVSLPL
jgi:uncharacterized protein YuzE